LKSCRSANGSASISSVPYCHKLINIRLFGLGAVTVKRRRLIYDLVSCRWTLPQCGLSAIMANQQQSMGIQLAHLKGNRGALETFMVLACCKIRKLNLGSNSYTYLTRLTDKNNAFKKFRPDPTCQICIECDPRPDPTRPAGRPDPCPSL